MGLIQQSSVQQYISAAETSLKTEGIDAVRSAEMRMRFKCDIFPFIPINHVEPNSDVVINACVYSAFVVYMLIYPDAFLTTAKNHSQVH